MALVSMTELLACGPQKTVGADFDTHVSCRDCLQRVFMVQTT